MRLSSEDTLPKKPTYRQWLMESDPNGTETYCHLVEFIFEPNKFTDYTFVTKFYRYSIHKDKISANELEAIKDTGIAIVVLTQEGKVALETSDGLPANWVLHNVKGTYSPVRGGVRFDPKDPTILPNDSPVTLRTKRNSGTAR